MVDQHIRNILTVCGEERIPVPPEIEHGWDPAVDARIDHQEDARAFFTWLQAHPEIDVTKISLDQQGPASHRFVVSFGYWYPDWEICGYTLTEIAASIEQLVNGISKAVR